MSTNDYRYLVNLLESGSLTQARNILIYNRDLIRDNLTEVQAMIDYYEALP